MAAGVHMEAFVIVEVRPHKAALPAREVEQVLRMVALTPRTWRPARLDGAFDLDGRAIPVVSLGAWLGVAPRPPSPDDHLVLLRESGRLLALRVDRVVDLAVVEADAVVATDCFNPAVIVMAVKLPTGLAVVPRLDAIAAECLDASSAP